MERAACMDSTRQNWVEETHLIAGNLIEQEQTLPLSSSHAAVTQLCAKITPSHKRPRAILTSSTAPPLAEKAVAMPSRMASLYTRKEWPPTQTLWVCWKHRTSTQNTHQLLNWARHCHLGAYGAVQNKASLLSFCYTPLFIAEELD